MQQTDIKWKTSSILLTIYLPFFILLAGCNTDIEDIPEIPPNPSNTTPGEISEKLIAHIYFDATISMEGFVFQDSTKYTQICPYLESVILSGWIDGKAVFYRFGEQVESIDRYTYLQAGTRDFYNNTRINRETLIERVIYHEEKLDSNQVSENNILEDTEEISEEPEVVNSLSDGNRLIVIVTDLFQDRRDINLLVSKLRDKYIKKDLEIGLFGLRSQFQGTVFDTGYDDRPLPYQSNPEDPESYRPFYLLVIGRYANIAHYFDRLKENGFDDAETIIFSRYLVSPLLSFDGMVDKTDNLNRKIINPKHSQNPRLKQYEIVDNSEPASISAKLEYKPLPHAMSFDVDTFEVSIITKCSDEGESKLAKAKASLKVIPTLSKNNDSNELNVEFSLDSQSLPRKAVYLYEVTLSPNVDTFQAPEWCSKWDMGDERYGAKTLNLVNFVRDLSLVTARRKPHPQIAKFYCYVKKR